MGGPGSGGYKSAPGDTETHAAWDIIQPESDSTQVSSQFAVKRRSANIFLEAGTSKMQVLFKRDGSAYVPSAIAPAAMSTIPRSDERSGYREYHH